MLCASCKQAFQRRFDSGGLELNLLVAVSNHGQAPEMTGTKGSFRFPFVRFRGSYLVFEVETKVPTNAVKRNLRRFPLDFMFQSDSEEAACFEVPIWHIKRPGAAAATDLRIHRTSVGDAFKCALAIAQLKHVDIWRGFRPKDLKK